MDYSQYIVALSVATAYPAEDENFAAALPAAIDYAEGRIYRDPAFDFLTLHGTATSGCGIGNRNVTKPDAIFIVEAMNIITPAGVLPDDGKRNPCVRISKPYLDAVYPGPASDTTLRGIPRHYASLSDTAWRVGPAPDATYTIEWEGVTLPIPLSAVNKTTYLTLYMPELFIAASMIFLCGGLLKNFGAQSDNPQQSQSWENQFNLLKLGPAILEARKKAESAGWTPKPPTAIANPPR